MSLSGHFGCRGDDEMPASSRRRQASRFTYKNLADLAAASPTCPLRVLAHIDLDAYYAQCEMLRLGTDEDTPLVVQQWRNIIAVNYPARKFGITRMISAAEAKKLCPTLVVQHVPSWKEGEGQWAYHADSFSAMAHHKVSLEPYRIRSREILATLKDSLPSTRTMASPCKIEKAGIDEVFVDLSPYIHDLLVNKLFPDVLARYRERSHDEPATELPLPPVTEADLDWDATGSGVIDHVDERKPGEAQREDIDKGLLDERDVPVDSQDHNDGDSEDGSTIVDWDDVAMLEGARAVQAMRQALFDKLRFRCSAGVASNKMLSKLGSSQHKPNKQTVVRPRAVSKFLTSLSSVSKLRGLGGKMGARVVAAFDTESIAELLTVPLPQMQAKLNDQEAGYSIYWMIRGIDTSDVTARTEIKSIISAKSFQPPLTTMDQAMRWLRVYVAELKCRLLDEKLSLALLAAATVVAPPPPPPTVADPAAAVATTTKTTTHTSGTSASATPMMTTSNDEAGDNQETPNLPNGGDLPEPKHTTPASIPLPVPVTSSKQHQLRLPQTIRLHYGHGNGQGWRSRQTRIPRDGTPLDEDKLLRLGKQLLEQAQRADSLWPCAHLALSVDGFEEPVKGNKSIESFFQPKSSASATATKSTAGEDEETGSYYGKDGNDKEHDSEIDLSENDGGADAPHAGDVDPDGNNSKPLAKRRRMEVAGPHNGEQRFRSKRGEAESSRVSDERPVATSSGMASGIDKGARPQSGRGIKRRAEGPPPLSSSLSSSLSSFFGNQRANGSSTGHAGHDNNDCNSSISSKNNSQHVPAGTAIGSLQAGQNDGLVCARCSQMFATAVQLQEHQDWHVARDLQSKEKRVLTPSTTSAPGGALVSSSQRRRGGAAHSKRTGPPPPSISSFFQTQPQNQDHNIQYKNRARSPPQNDGRVRPQWRIDANTDETKTDETKTDGPSCTGMQTDSLSCQRCGAVFGHAGEVQVHQDWHFAKDLAGS
ncbi:sister chromatid cohesion protein [Ophiostoma piceae UAMH 11346]|uniref:Sister chromatid cohesion protein n=1 Tax=Ophiostoma piceae (strain UAMH 11346) TaxID=1262450 RepID=S3BYM6_OPHP1|nr:sister chromatid cohesion protein [Ophiostoma piceae UAMH 11346]